MRKIENVLWSLAIIAIPVALIYGAATQTRKRPPAESPAEVQSNLPTAETEWPALDESPPAPPTEGPDLQQLLNACVAETRNGATAKGSNSACEQYAAADRLRLPPRTYEKPKEISPPSTPSPFQSAPNFPTAYDYSLEAAKDFARQCGSYIKGSIKYRDCRAETSKRLTQICRKLNAEAERMSGEQRQAHMQQAKAWCWVADRFHIID